MPTTADNAYRDPEDNDGYHKGALERALKILLSFAPEGQPLRLVDIASRTGLPKSTIHRIMTTLQGYGLIDRSPGKRYSLGGKLFEIGMMASVERTMIEVASPFLQELHQQSGETIHLGIQEGCEVVYIAKVSGHAEAPMPSRLGGRMPLHCTAIGKALLAFSGESLTARVLNQPLERLTPRTVIAPGLLRSQFVRILEEGVAFEQEESTRGVACAAAPILNTEDMPIAAISIASSAARFRREAFATLVRSAAMRIGITLVRRSKLSQRAGSDIFR